MRKSTVDKDASIADGNSIQSNGTVPENKGSVGHAWGETIRRHIWLTILLVVVIAASVVMALLPPIVLGHAVDLLTDNKAISAGLAVLYFALLAAGGFLDAGRETLITIFGEKMTHALRSEMSEKMYRLPAEYYTGHASGEVSSRIVNDVDTVEDLFSSGIVSMITDLATVVSMLVVIFMKSRGLGLILVVVLPLIFLYTRHVQKETLSAQVANRRAVAQASGRIPETVSNIRSIHTYHAEHFLEERYDSDIVDSFNAVSRTNFYDAIYSPIILTVSAAVVGIMMSLAGAGGSFRAFFGMTVGSAVALISYVSSIFTPIQSIGMEIQTIQSAMAGIARIREFLNEEERQLPPEKAGVAQEKDNAAASIEDSDQKASGQMEERKSLEKNKSGFQNIPALEIRHVSFSYDKKQQVIKDLNLTVQPGESLLVTGRTGAGKSTLFRLLLGLYTPDQGDVLIFGRQASEIPDEDRRYVFGYVQQSFSPVPGTIGDQITLSDERIPEVAIEQALEITGLDDVIASLPDGLDMPYSDSIFSQGQKQLLDIARAIVTDPQILLLDEITASLDSRTEKRVMEALRRVSENRTVITISHRLYDQAEGGKTVRELKLS